LLTIDVFFNGTCGVRGSTLNILLTR